MSRAELWRIGATGSLATYGGATQKGCPPSCRIVSCVCDLYERFNSFLSVIRGKAQVKEGMQVTRTEFVNYLQ